MRAAASSADLIGGVYTVYAGQTLRLTPRNTDTQRILSHRIEIDPLPSSRCQLTDYFGNSVTQFLFNQGYTTLSISAYDEVEMLLKDLPSQVIVPDHATFIDGRHWEIYD